MDSNVLLHLDIERGEFGIVIDDKPYQVHCAETRRELGDGIIRDDRGQAVAQHALDIPEREWNALLNIGDKDALEFDKTRDMAALRRLVLRYPHWLICDGAVIRRYFGQ